MVPWRRGGQMVSRGTETPHQLSRVIGGLICDQDSVTTEGELLHSIENGQCLSSPIYQSAGGHQVEVTCGDSQGFLALLSPPPHFSDSGIHSGQLQCGSGLEFSFSSRFQRLAPSTQDFLETQQQVGSLCDRPFRVQAQYTTASVLQLETRPSGEQLGRLPSIMDDWHAICISSVRHDPESVSADPQAESGGDVDIPVLESTSVVPSGAGSFLCVSNTSAIISQDLDGPSGSASSSGTSGPIATHGVETFRRRWQVPGVSENTLFFLSQSWAPATHKRYESAWPKWVSWCAEQQGDPMGSGIHMIVNFLSEMASSGLAYRTVNNFRSAISVGHSHVGGKPVGNILWFAR